MPGITVSIGVAAFPEAGDNPEMVLKAADEALYRAKEKGRNRVEFSTIATADPDAPARPVAMRRGLAASFYVPAEEQEQPAVALLDASRPRLAHEVI